MRPEVPRRVPPKYRVTTIRTLVNPLLSICPRMGLPAVPEGSPSSFALYLRPSRPMRQAKQW